MQGSGTFGVESVIASVIPPQGRLLILANGAYGERIAKIATCLKIDHHVLRSEEELCPGSSRGGKATARRSPAITHVALVHCETTTGILNPLEPIGRVVQRCKRSFIVDAMSSFGAIPINLPETGIDYLGILSEQMHRGGTWFQLHHHAPGRLASGSRPWAQFKPGPPGPAPGV